ncbi:heme ABC transporter ATP-binding protein [Gilvimarinus agarilyticus]|uniref:heme ABC transporter ATP-binding protein n=1 Tax=Gilvimarinus agarilyticus TaxID=679259 RepID=UPI00069902D9|nr:heme ABC transporter ATP-binding protein [Gilvimarinus agarilyticus]
MNKTSQNTPDKGVLTIENLSVSIGSRTLINNINLAVDAGEVLCVIGPNGAGKTTLLRTIGQDLTPDSGHISFAQQPLTRMAPRARARQLAVLTQHNPLTFAFTGREVVALGRSPHSTGVVIDDDICQAAMAALDVSHLAQRLYPSLSGGEQQRIQLARVLAQIWRAEDASTSARLLLLDEPVTSLDIGHQHQLMQAVREFARTDVAVVMTVHDITLAGAFADRIIALKNGECIAEGSPHEVLTESLISHVFDTPVSIINHPQTGKPVVLGATETGTTV